MSYQTWHNYGYGFCVSDLEIDSPARIEALLDKAPNYKEKVHNCFKENKITVPTIEDYFEYVDDCDNGFATILSEVMSEATGIYFTDCNDFDEKEYVIYMPSYPWNLNDNEVDLTERRLKKLYNKFASVISDSKIEVDYQSVENGG